MIRSLNLEEVAFRIGRSYEWTRENWRSTAGFPRPYVGGGYHQQPRWTEHAIDAFMLNSGTVDEPMKSAPLPPPPPANDKRPSRKQKLLTAAGG